MPCKCVNIADNVCYVRGEVTFSAQKWPILYVRGKFPQLSDAKVKEGIFVGPLMKADER